MNVVHFNSPAKTEYEMKKIILSIKNNLKMDRLAKDKSKNHVLRKNTGVSCHD